MGLFEKFLIYEARIHPEIRKAMVSNRCLPKRMRFRYETTSGKSEVEWISLQADTQSTTAYTKELQMAPPAQSDEVDRLISEELPAIADRGLRGEDFEKMFAKSIDLRSYLDAMLVSVEFYLMSGQQTINALQTIKPFIETDPQLLAYLSGLDVSSKAAARLSMIELAEIDRTNLFRQHILDVALADTFKETLKYKAAEELYIKALQQNPYMTGVWVNLGDLYYRTMRMEKAWNCWNAAFALQSDHPALDPIKDRNTLLSDGFPEYF
jgi:tetratricopeptide (TPR) repeat protein